jgi:amidase
LLKDAGAMVAGDPMHMGMRALRGADWRAPFDNHFVARLRDAGFVFVGRTNTPEVAGLASTESAAYGSTSNPWSLTHTAGGSSGGSAAAVAARMVAAAHGNDAGGSIRIPASACGVVGLKPSRGRVSAAPLGAVAGGFGVDGMLCRSVRDAGALLDVIAGPEPGDQHLLPATERPFVEHATSDPGRLRIAVAFEPPAGAGPTDVECIETVQQVADTLEAAGHIVTEESPPWPAWETILANFIDLWSVSTLQLIDTLALAIARPISDDELEPHNAALLEHARHLTALQHANRLQEQGTINRRLGTWWAAGHDLLLTPTVRTPPPELGKVLVFSADPLEDWRRHFSWLPFTPIWNATGQPAISLPTGQSAAGLPIGVQLVAAYGREDLLLQVASQLEMAMPWRDRLPPLLDRPT